MPSGRGDDADHVDAAWRRPPASRSSAATALPPVASIGSIIRTKLDVEARRQLGVVPRRDRRHLVALQADVADARVGHELEHGVEHAEAGAQHRHDDDVGADPAAGRRAERRLDGDLGARHVAQRFGGEQHADARGRAAEVFGRRALVAQVDERVLHERMIDEVDRHGSTLYNFSTACVHTVASVVAVRARGVAVARLSGRAAGSAAAHSLVVVGGTVVTENAHAPGARRRAPSRSTAPTSSTSIAPRRLPRATRGAERSTPRDQIVLPGLINTHTHAPMVMYRGLADDLALMDWLQKYIFPAEAKTVSPEFVRIGTRLAALEMIESGTTTYADMYYFEEEIAKATREAGLRGVLGQTIIQFPVADAKTPAEGAGPRRSLHQGVQGRRLIVPAVAPHAMYTLDRGDAPGLRRAGAPATTCPC